MKSLPLFTCSLVVGISSLSQAQAAPSAQQVLRACANTYKSLREFKGSAVVVDQSRIEGTLSLSKADADFDFVRGNHFNISGHDSSGDPYSINSTPQKTTTKWSPYGKNETETARDVSSAVASFTGVAVLAPSTVPALLLERDYKYPFKVAAPATLKPSVMFGGHLCYVVVQKTMPRPGNRTLWIDAKTFLLRGMNEEYSNYSFTAPNPEAQPGDKKSSYEKIHVEFSSLLHVFSIEKTLPSEAALESAAKTITR